MLQWTGVPNHDTPFTSGRPLGAATSAELAKPVDKAADAITERSASAAVWVFMTPNVRAKPRATARRLAREAQDTQQAPRGPDAVPLRVGA